MKSLTLIVGLVSGIPAVEKRSKESTLSTDGKSKCTIDDITFKCNDERMHFEFENCKNDDSDDDFYYGIRGNDSEKCSMKGASTMEFGYEDCGTRKKMIEDTITYTATLQRYEESPLIDPLILTDENFRTFSCTLPRKFIASNQYNVIVKGEEGQDWKMNENGIVLKIDNEIVGDIASDAKNKAASLEDSENRTENETDDLMEEDIHHNSSENSSFCSVLFFLCFTLFFQF